MNAEHARLRAFALRLINEAGGWDDVVYGAIAALGHGASEDAWLDYREVRGKGDGQWFYWRDPLQPNRLHVDQADFDGSGKIDCKHGCGLAWFTECQPCTFDFEVLRQSGHIGRDRLPAIRKPSPSERIAAALESMAASNASLAASQARIAEAMEKMEATPDPVAQALGDWWSIVQGFYPMAPRRPQ